MRNTEFMIVITSGEYGNDSGTDTWRASKVLYIISFLGFSLFSLHYIFIFSVHKLCCTIRKK